jgi:hypothetical protein
MQVEEGNLEPDDDAERFLEEETPVVEMAQELDLSAKCSKMEVKIKELEEALQAKIATESEPQEKANTDDASEEANSQKIQEKRNLNRQRQKTKKAQAMVLIPKLSEVILFKDEKDVGGGGILPLKIIFCLVAFLFFLLFLPFHQFELDRKKELIDYN